MCRPTWALPRRRCRETWRSAQTWFVMVSTHTFTHRYVSPIHTYIHKFTRRYILTLHKFTKTYAQVRLHTYILGFYTYIRLRMICYIFYALVYLRTDTFTIDFFMCGFDSFTRRYDYTFIRLRTCSSTYIVKILKNLPLAP